MSQMSETPDERIDAPDIDADDGIEEPAAEEDDAPAAGTEPTPTVAPDAEDASDDDDASDQHVSDADITEGDISEADVSAPDTSAGDTAEGDTSGADISDQDICEGDISEAGFSEAGFSEAELSDGPEDDPVVVQFETPEVRVLREEVESLNGMIAELQGRLRAVSAAYRQQQDDMTAVRARLERQAAVKEELRRGEVVASLFEPVQNLRRSQEAAARGASAEDTAEGLKMVLSQFMAAFEGLGLEEVPGKGARFDPNLHEALTMIPITDPALDGVVIDVFAAGYRIGNRLITPAKVIIGQLPEDAEPVVAEA